MGKITLISRQKRNRERLNLHVDGEYFCSMDEEVALRHGLFVGQEVDAADFAALFAEDERKSAMDTALRYLARARTTKEIGDKLAEKGYGEETTAVVLEKLAGWGYLDDLSYAAALIKDKLSGGKSRKEIDYALYLKGVDKETAREAWEMVQPDAEREAAIRYARKRLKGAPDKQARARVKNAMYRKGFGGDCIEAAFSELEAEEEDGDA